MKINRFGKVAASLIVTSLTFFTSWAAAQEASTTTTTTESAQTAAAPQLDYGVSQILQLSQAKVGDATIVAYIKNAGNSYRLDADQIIYLQQQGVSPLVVNAMLNQPKAGVLAATPPPAPAPAPGTDTPSASAQATYDASAVAPTSIVGPAVSGIDPTAAAIQLSSYNPYYYPYYPYPYVYPAYGYYGYYPGVAVSIGLGGWRGGGYRGAVYGGGFRAGGFHGGFHR